VAGTHGKTTTTSMLALVLVEAGMHPSFLVGGDLNEVGGGAVWDAAHTDAPFVVEADESDGTFLELGARDVLVTSVEPDHLDHWGGFDALVAAFERFVRDAPGLHLVGTDDAAGRALAAATGAATVGCNPDAEWSMRDLAAGRDGTRFSVVHDGLVVAEVDLAVPGVHNARNALSAVAMASGLGAPLEPAVRALERYAGVARRWQHRGEAGGATFVDDYAHLPTEVAAAIDTGRRGGWKRVVAVFQPHRYSRTAALWRSFADAFTGADVIVVTDIYPAGEPPRPGVSGKLIVDAVLEAHPTAHVAWMPTHRDVVAYLAAALRPGDLCLTLGAGDLTAVPDELMATIGARPAAAG
jgi:UDP-N-acetylmuramate--alanine ligase